MFFKRISLKFLPMTVLKKSFVKFTQNYNFISKVKKGVIK